MSPTSKLTLAVFGATGNQGNYVASVVLADPELSQRYAVRAISRDPSHAKMQDLGARGASLVAADMDAPETLPPALAGVDTLFFLTATQYNGNTRLIETRQARAVCEAALAAGVSYIIFSSMSHAFAISGGVLTQVEHFDAKAEIETYIRSLPNLMSHAMRPVPSPAGDGSYILANCARAETRMPFIDITETGKWVGAILAAPDKYAGRTFAAAAEILSMEQVAQIVQRVTGKVVRHRNLPDDVFKGFMPQGMQQELLEMWILCREYGYYGKTMEQDVAWARENARGEVTGLEAFLNKHEYALE